MYCCTIVNRPGIMVDCSLSTCKGELKGYGGLEYGTTPCGGFLCGKGIKRLYRKLTHKINTVHFWINPAAFDDLAKKSSVAEGAPLDFGLLQRMGMDV